MPMVSAGLGSGCLMVGEMVVKRLWLRGGWLRPYRGWKAVGGWQGKWLCNV